MLKKMFITLSAICLTTSCGYFGDKAKDESSIYDASSMQTECKLDGKILAKIFEQDISSQLSCLEMNLKNFKYVERNNNTEVYRQEIDLYIAKFFDKNADTQTIKKSVDLLFDIYHVFFNKKKSIIQNEDISKLTSLLVIFNQEASQIYQSLNETQTRTLEARHLMYKNALFNYSQRVQMLMGRSFLNSDCGDNEINIVNFLEKLEFDIHQIRPFLFLKTLFLGGKQEILTAKELRDFIQKLPKLGNLYFEFLNFKENRFKNEDDKSLRILEIYRDIKSSFFKHKKEVVIVENDQLIDALKILLDNDFDIEKFLPTLELLKEKIIGGDAKSFNYEDILKIASFAKEITEGIYFNNVTYSYFEKELTKDAPITITEFPRLIEYKKLSSDSLNTAKKNFQTLVKKLRLYRNEDGLQYYKTEIIRTKYGFNEFFVISWALDQLFKVYGVKSTDGYSVSDVELTNFLLEIRPILEELNLWTPNIKTFASNVILLGTLFQPSSNGNSRLESDEATEYISLVFTALQAGKDLVSGIKNYCPNIGPLDNPTYTLECYRKHFFQVIFDDFGYQKYLQNLYDYVQTTPKEELNEFFVKIEMFARDDHSENAGPVIERDLLLVFGAMLNVESVLLRFDENKDKKLSPNEVEKAFPIYKDTIIMLGNLQGKESYAIYAFKYLIKYHKTPTSTQLLRFMYSPFEDRKVSASRVDLATLLYFIVISQPQNVAD